jgi:hypothetical protein
MKFGGLSEQEVAKISAILNGEGIAFSIESDADMQEFNTTSMRNNLRHMTPPNISTHVLAIIMDDEVFLKMSDATKSKLLDFGITDKAPEDFQPFSGTTIHEDLVHGPRRMIGFNLKHQLVVGLIMLAVIYFVKTYL